ncbi:MAG: DUF4349 domain-containing protein [Patescibacteria group bacterium]|nr:DUF4349 domain-containing protein [Patescibacteria group bacterium]
MRLRNVVAIVLVGVMILGGCGGPQDASRHQIATEVKMSEPSAKDVAGDASIAGGDASMAGIEAGEPQGNVPGGDDEPIGRKIIYRANLDLIVEDFSGIPKQVENLAEQHGGFVAGSSLSGAAGSPRSGNWTVRVPVGSYGTFLEEAQRLGEFRTLRSESEEVTGEFYDVQTRIRNRKIAEDRLLALLQERTGQLDDVIKIEQHLSQVREEIERLEGRLRVLGNLTAFSTVTISIHEVQGYVPPQVATFGQRIHRAWTDSVNSLRVAGENAAILLTELAPWLIVLAIPLVVVVWIGRRWYSRLRR